jgi:hypothetical protein
MVLNMVWYDMVWVLYGMVWYGTNIVMVWSGCGVEYGTHTVVGLIVNVNTNTDTDTDTDVINKCVVVLYCIR